MTALTALDTVETGKVASVDLATGSVRLALTVKPELFFRVLSEKSGLEIADELSLMETVTSLSRFASPRM